MSDELKILDADERKSRLMKKNIEEKEKIEKEKIETQDTAAKFCNRGGKVKINYETMGRFDIPKTLYFEDYTVEHISDISLTSEEDLLETIVSILNDIKNEDSNCKVEDMTLEEFLETMIAIKMSFNTVMHDHRWICMCQLRVPDNEKKLNSKIIDLRKLNYRSIEQAELDLKKYYKEFFEELTDEEFKEYIKFKYKYNPDSNININTLTKEQEIENIKIKEPIICKVEDDIFGFRFTRIRDLITAQKIVDNKYMGEIKKIKNIPIHNKSDSESKENRKEKLDLIDKKKAKELLTTTKALSIMTYNGEEITDNNKKIELYSKLKRQHFLALESFLDNIKFGIENEEEFECEQCGTSDRRSLQQAFNSFEFLPFDPNTRDKTQERTRRNIFVGI